MNTNTLEVQYHQDPGHGWLEVTRAMVDRLGIAPKISRYSYQSATGTAVYLEEDCDAALFVRAIEASGTKVHAIPHHYKFDAPIRAMQRFTA